MQLIAARTRTLFRTAVGAYADILQLFVQIAQQLFWYQRSFSATPAPDCTGSAARNGYASRRGRGCVQPPPAQALTQFFIEIAVAVQHFRRIGIAEVGTTLNHFAQRKRLLPCIALHLLRIGIVFFQLFKLFRVALQDGNDRLQFRQLIAILLNKARRFLGFIQPFLNFVNAVGQRIVRQQVKARQQAVKGGNPSFACSNCTRFCWLSLSCALSARSSSPRRLLSLRISSSGSSSNATARWLPIKRLKAWC